MEINANVSERPDVSAEEQVSQHLIMRILKLRWMGLDIEADEAEVALRRVDPACTLLAGPFDTD